MIINEVSSLPAGKRELTKYNILELTKKKFNLNY
jgi:hypothetical protein